MLDTYSGVRSFNALYVRTALLYISLLSIEGQPSSLNMSADGVLKSALRIILGDFGDSNQYFNTALPADQHQTSVIT